jgi:hypothetical protein
MGNPVWVTIIAAVGGAVVGLVASVMTTFLTNRYAMNRQKADLAHSEKMEREKLLFAARMELYAKAPEMIARIQRHFTCVLEQLSYNVSIEQLHPSDSNMKIVDEVKSFHQGTVIVSSKPVMDSASRLQSLVLQANGVLHKMRETAETGLPRDFSLPELVTGGSELYEQIRIELGVGAGEGLLR